MSKHSHEPRKPDPQITPMSPPLISNGRPWQILLSECEVQGVTPAVQEGLVIQLATPEYLRQ